MFQISRRRSLLDVVVAANVNVCHALDGTWSIPGRPSYSYSELADHPVADCQWPAVPILLTTPWQSEPTHTSN